MSFQEDSNVWQQAQDDAWNELNYRRTNRICARCGTTVWCYVREIEKYKSYVKDCKYEHHNNSIDDQAASQGMHICSPCGNEIHKGKLGINSERINNNEDYVIEKLTKVRKLCFEHTDLLAKKVTLTNRIHRDTHTTWDNEDEQKKVLKEAQSELSTTSYLIMKAEMDIDELVNLSTITAAPNYNDI